MNYTYKSILFEILQSEMRIDENIERCNNRI